MQDNPIEILIAGTLVTATNFARMLGWSHGQTTHEFRKPNGDVVRLINSHEQMFGLRKCVLHVGPFGREGDSQARKRHMLNIAESRGIHVVYYDFEMHPPEPVRICLVCGAHRPCLWKEDLQPGELGVPCTFDPTPFQLFQRLRKVEKENAQLRKDFNVAATAIQKLVTAYTGLGEEIRKVEGFIKAYRTPTRNS